MIKKLSFLLVSNISLLPAMAFNVHANTENNKARDIDKNFDTFTEICNKKITKLKEQIISSIKNTLESYIQTTKNNNNVSLDKKILKLTYLKELLKYFSTSTFEALLKDSNNSPSSGIPIIFPFLITTFKEYKHADIDFNGEVYKNLKIAQKTYFTYEELITGNGNDIKFIDENNQRNEIKKIDSSYKINSAVIKNIFNKEEIENTLNKYCSELLKNLNKFIFDEKDIPNISFDYDDPNKITWKVPDGYSNWSHYIFSKIYPRFLAFDLKQNQEASIKQDEKPINKQENTPLLPPNDTTKLKPNEVGEFDPSEIKKAIVTLKPYISPEYSNLSLYEIEKQFKNNPDIFFFFNPINTRYEYRVIDFKIENDFTIKKVKIHLHDRNNPSLAKSYIIDKVVYDSKIDERVINSNFKKTEYDTLLNIMNALYDSLCLINDQEKISKNEKDKISKIDYDKLRNPHIVSALFNMVNVANERILIDDENNKSLYNSIETKLFEKYRGNFDIKNKNNDILSDLSYKTASNFLSDLQVAEIELDPFNKINYWSLLPTKFEIIFNDYKKVIKNDDNRKIINENFKTIENGNLEILEESFTSLEKHIYKFKAISSSNRLNIHAWYDNYIDEIKEIMNLLNIISPLISNEEIKNNKEKISNFQICYNKAKNIAKENNLIKSKQSTGISATIMSIGFIILICNLIILFIKNKEIIKNNRLMTILIIISITSLSMIITGSVLLGLGLKGF
ncbi:MSC_0620 family F1-like ATPase-associated subunit [Mycoplasma elephantis]|uniref:MSC_0620 family F1-like ATPase-associated subunit n=1 Tax=Mycoplasma elephantis TaxID=114882 RepID=UPI000481D8C5|nr:hypothetical protein [Mycoplasma elephantis]